MLPVNRCRIVVNARSIAGNISLAQDDVIFIPERIKSVTVQSKFVYGSGGGTCKVFLQTTLDEGATWVDVMAHAFLLASATKISSIKKDVAQAPALAPTDGALTDDTIRDGLWGDRFRIKIVSGGTAYAGATALTVSLVLG